jgi:hypothetical protein
MEIKNQTIVHGCLGIVNYIKDHLDDLENGLTIQWSTIRPNNWEGLSFNELKDRCEEWCCIHSLDQNACFDAHNTILYMDYMGGYNPQVIVVNDYPWEDTLWDCLDDIIEGKHFYIETVNWEA